MIGVYNYFWLAFASASILQPIVSAIVNDFTPPMIEISAHLGGKKEEVNEEDVLVYSLIIELFNLFRGLGFVIWYFYCNHLVKQRKVTLMEKLLKIFRPMIGLYFVMFFVEIVVAIIELSKI